MQNNLQRLDQALTSKKWQWFIHSEDACPACLLDVFVSRLPHISAESWQTRLALGGAYVNGLEVRENVALSRPCKIEYYEPKFNIEDIHSTYPAFSEDWIVYQDNYVIVVYKPNGLPCLPTKEQKIYNLRNYVEQYSGKTVHMPSRIDSSTQGLVILSLHEKMHNYLQKCFEKRTVVKRYLLESSHPATWEAKFLKAAIGKDPAHPILRTVVSDGGRESTTIFTKVQKSGDHSFLFARPLTGRTHQIRVHAAHLGLPIVGDNFYGGIQSEYLHLLSYELGLWQPFEQKYLKARVPDNLMPAWAKDAF